MHSSRMRTAHSSSCLLAGVCVPQCMLGYTPQAWVWRPPWVWPWRLPLGVGLDSPGVGLETPLPGQTLQPPPWAWA